MHYYRFRNHGDPLYEEEPENIKKRYKKLHESQKGRIPWNKGKTGVYSEETKKKMSVSQFKKGSIPHNKGKKVTEKERKKMIEAMNRPEVKKKLSESKKGSKNPMYGKPSHNRGKPPSLETRKKISESLKKIVKYYSKEERLERSRRAKEWFAIHGHNRKGVKDTPETFKKKSLAQKGKKTSEDTKRKIGIGNKGKIRSRETKAKISAYRAKQKFPYKDTKIELLTQSILEENNIIFKKHKNYKLSESNHQADITIEPDKVIEVNGDYWHFNPKKYDGKSKQKKRGKEIKAEDVWKYDKYLIDGMNDQGYRVLVVWESELEDELNKTTKKILKFAKS
jgi:G:T-mismatch repair DNA endonuclease (very short patch repair protein)